MATLADPASHSLASRDFQNCCLATGCCTSELHFSGESDRRMIVTSIAFGFFFFFTLRASVREDDRNNERKTQKTETEEG